MPPAGLAAASAGAAERPPDPQTQTGCCPMPPHLRPHPPTPLTTKRRNRYEAEQLQPALRLHPPTRLRAKAPPQLQLNHQLLVLSRHRKCRQNGSHHRHQTLRRQSHPDRPGRHHHRLIHYPPRDPTRHAAPRHQLTYHRDQPLTRPRAHRPRRLPTTGAQLQHHPTKRTIRQEPLHQTNRCVLGERQGKAELVPHQGASGAGHHWVPPGVDEAAAASSVLAVPARSGKVWEPAEEVPRAK